MVKIIIGSIAEPQYVFTGDSIFSVNVRQSVGLVGQELSVDTLDAVVLADEDETRNVTVFVSTDGIEITVGDGSIYAVSVGEYSPSGLILVPYGTPVWYSNDNELVGKFYLQKVKRQGKKTYKISASSAVELLDKMDHGGGLYQQATFGDVLHNILRKEVE